MQSVISLRLRFVLVGTVFLISFPQRNWRVQVDLLSLLVVVVVASVEDERLEFKELFLVLGEKQGLSHVRGCSRLRVLWSFAVIHDFAKFIDGLDFVFKLVQFALAVYLNAKAGSVFALLLDLVVAVAFAHVLKAGPVALEVLQLRQIPLLCKLPTLQRNHLCLIAIEPLCKLEGRPALQDARQVVVEALQVRRNLRGCSSVICDSLIVLVRGRPHLNRVGLEAELLISGLRKVHGLFCARLLRVALPEVGTLSAHVGLGSARLHIELHGQVVKRALGPRWAHVSHPYVV